MTRPKHSTSGAEAILARLREAAANAPREHVKFIRVKQALLQAAADASADLKLPPVRDIAAASNVALAPAQRAVKELVEDGILYSKPRSGTFVSGTRPPTATNPAAGLPTKAGPFAEFHNRVVFATDSGWEFQQRFWRELADRFESLHPNVEIDIAVSAEPDLPAGRDVYERMIWFDRFPETEVPLDISRLLAEENPSIATEWQTGGLPLYYRTYYLFFNRDLLREMDAPKPDYRNFAEQIEYIKMIGEMCRQLGLEPRPSSACEPVTLLGRAASDTLEAIHADEQSLSENILDAWRQTARLCRLFRYGDAALMENFLNGRCPLYFGYGVDLWWLLNHPPSFDWAAYPGLCADDRMFLWPRLGAVSSRSKYPLEATRFLAFLRESGQAFAGIGEIPANSATVEIPHLCVDKSWYDELIRMSTPWFLQNATECYLVSSALNNELRQLTLNPGRTAEAAAQRALRLGRAYLQTIASVGG
jgi:hypothetical protein